MTLRTTVTTVSDSIIVTLEGMVDLASVGTLHNDLARVVRRHPGAVLVIDLDSVDTLDDVGLGVLLGAAAAARELGGDIEVVCSRPALVDRFRRSRFDRAITVRSTIVAASGDRVLPRHGVVVTPDAPIFHLALAAHWADAFTTGEYRMSTRDMTLDQVGFIHCSTREQLQDTANRFYADIEQLVVLTIDPELVPSPIIHEPPAPGLDLLFPHIYGPLPVAAVNHANVWVRTPGAPWSLTS